MDSVECLVIGAGVVGLAIARKLAGAGYNVIAVARGESEKLREAAKEGNLRFRACDLSDVEAIPAFVK